MRTMVRMAHPTQGKSRMADSEFGDIKKCFTDHLHAALKERTVAVAMLIAGDAE